MAKNDRYARVCELVLEAIELSGAERSAYLDRECGDDAELRSEVEALLAQEDAEESFLDRPVVDFFARPPVPADSVGLPIGRIATLTFDSAAAIPGSAGEPESIRHYRILREIGRGGMGVVYEGRDEKLDRRVAIKAIHWDRATDGERRARFRQEARLLAALDHPNIGAIYSFEETERGHYLILEFIEGRTLAQLVGEAPLPVERTVDIATQVAAALQAAHERGIVHRDLSPGNVMVREDGVAKVLDFGLARSAGVVTGTRTLSSGPIAGTPSFMSPELLHGAPSSRAADSWAFACLLYEALTGERAFLAPTLAGIFDAILHGRPDLDRLPAETPAGVREAIEQCWIKDPRHRLDDMSRIRGLLGGASLGLSQSRLAEATERWSVTWQPLVSRARRGETVPMRLFVENALGRDVELTISIEPNDTWRAIGSDREALRVPAKGAMERLFPIAAEAIGTTLLPSVTIELSGRTRAILPVPSRIEIDAAAPPEVFGRDAVLERLTQHATSLGGEPGRTLAISGPDGSGRTTLLDAVARRARSARVRVVRATGHVGLREPLELLVDLTRAYLGVFEPLRDRDPRIDFARGRLREYLGDSSPVVKHFLDLLRGADPETLDDPMQHYRAYQLLSAAASQTPTLFVVDDAGLADERSLETLAGVIARARTDGLPIGAIFVTLPEEVERVARFQPEIVELHPLDTPAIDAMIEALRPGSNHRDYVPRLAEGILEHSGGQPGSVRETLEALSGGDAATALFHREADRWHLELDCDVETRLASIPTGYAALVERRLASIADASRTTLHLAALCGPEFPVDPLEELVESEEELDDALDDLERAGIIAPARSDLSRYRFSSPGFVPLVVAEIDRSGSRRAARLRRRVADALIAHFSANRGTTKDSEELGMTLIGLGQHEAALPHLLTALGRRVRSRQVAEATRVVRRIEELERDRPIEEVTTRYEWLSLQGKALTLAGQLERAKVVTEEARQLAERANDPGGALLCFVLLAEIAIRRGRFEAGRDLALTTRDRALENGLGWVAREANRNLAIAYRRLGERAAAEAIWEEDLERAIAEGDKLGEIRGQNNLGIIDYEVRAWDRARPRFERAAAVAHELDHLEYEMIARVWLANIAFERGELEQAERGYREAIEAFQRLQNRRALSRNYYNAAIVHRLLGRFDDALADFARATDLCRELGDPATELRYRVDAAGCAIDGGDWAAAEREYTRIQSAVSKLGAVAVETELRLAIVELQLGQRDRAERVTQSIATHPQVPSLAALGEAPLSLLRLISLVLLEPERRSDADFVRRARELLTASRDFGDVRERVQLAAALTTDGTSPADLEQLESWTGDALRASALSSWAEVARSSIAARK